jgi:hypothetical protein
LLTKTILTTQFLWTNLFIVFYRVFPKKLLGFCALYVLANFLL